MKAARDNPDGDGISLGDSRSARWALAKQPCVRGAQAEGIRIPMNSTGEPVIRTLGIRDPLNSHGEPDEARWAACGKRGTGEGDPAGGADLPGEKFGARWAAAQPERWRNSRNSHGDSRSARWATAKQPGTRQARSQ